MIKVWSFGRDCSHWKKLRSSLGHDDDDDDDDELFSDFILAAGVLLLDIMSIGVVISSTVNTMVTMTVMNYLESSCEKTLLVKHCDDSWFLESALGICLSVYMQCTCKVNCVGNV